MGAPITLFSGYSHGENRTTNYCLLILKMLYEENPKFLDEVVGAMSGDRAADIVGVKFQQQSKKNKSVPDGLISQKAFAVYIETKNTDWFIDAQIKNHLEALHAESIEGTKILLALANFEGDIEGRFTHIEKLCEKTYNNQIIFAAVSFAEFLEAVSSPQVSKNLADAIEDFRGYLDEQELLPSWQQWMDVPNCATMAHEVLTGNVYICPATGGNYNHNRCKYFGMYRWKTVEYVSDIRARVDISAPNVAHIKWNNTLSSPKPESNADLKQAALTALAKFRPGQFLNSVLVLGKLHKTDFQKPTKGGMRQSKMYFMVSGVEPISAQDLAAKLNGRKWNELPT